MGVCFMADADDDLICFCNFADNNNRLGAVDFFLFNIDLSLWRGEG
jgi:hypothetical protein